MNLSAVSKAIAGGLIAAVVGELARYGFHPSNDAVNAVGVIVTGLISYGAGHLVVFFAPSNKHPLDQVQVVQGPGNPPQAE